MRPRSPFRTIGPLPLVVLLLALAGCASFSHGRLPARSLDDLERGGKLIAITYQFSENSAAGSLEAVDRANLSGAATPTILQSRVEPIFRRVFIEARLGREPGEWHVDMYYRETARNPAVSITLGLFFLGSLGLLPAYAEDDLYLEAKLLHAGVAVKQYVFEERVATWMHWFVLPWAFSNDPIERKAQLVDNMILNLLHELKRNLPAPAPAP